jgi:signal transduction histidine kinase
MDPKPTHREDGSMRATFRPETEQNGAQIQQQLVATLVHELRDPLATLLTGLSVMRRYDVDEATVRRARERAERQAQHMARIIDDMLDLCRGERGKLSLRTDLVDLTAIVASAAEIAGPSLAARGHHLTIELPPAPVWLVADASRLVQVFTNLLTNAARYTEPCGDIRLVGEVTDDRVTVRVCDTGIGIAPDRLPHVFELVRPEDRLGSGAGAGLGIGLALAKSLVELHGGTIAARSEGPGTGSEFIVHLPRLGRDID